MASPAFISIRSPDRGRTAIFRGHRDRARLAACARSSNAGSRRILRARDGRAERCLWCRQIRLKKSQAGALESSVRRSSINIRSRRAKRCCRPMARFARIPASSPAAARRTSSPFATPPPTRRCGGPATSRSPRSSSKRSIQDFLKHAEGMTLFAQDLYGGADPTFQIKTRVFTELAWHSLFIRTLLIRPEAIELLDFRAGTHHHRHAELPRRSRNVTACARRTSSRSISPARSS